MSLVTSEISVYFSIFNLPYLSLRINHAMQLSTPTVLQLTFFFFFSFVVSHIFCDITSLCINNTLILPKSPFKRPKHLFNWVHKCHQASFIGYLKDKLIILNWTIARLINTPLSTQVLYRCRFDLQEEGLNLQCLQGRGI